MLPFKLDPDSGKLQDPDSDKLMTGPSYGVHYLDYLNATASAPT